MTHVSENPAKVSRRTVLWSAWGVALAAMIAQAGTAFIQFIRPRQASNAFGGKVPAGQVAEFKPGSISHIQAGRFYISHTDDGLIAMWQSCTHLGCTVPWVPAEDRFHCPCHGSLYNKKGEVIGGPAPRPLDLFAITIDKQEVVVDTSTPIQRSKYDPSQATKV
jgi:cytochrome b6-f complex iron-sulfur subunit